MPVRSRSTPKLILGRNTHDFDMTERVKAFEYDIDIVLLALLFRNLKDRLEAPVGLSNPLQIRNDSQSALACRKLEKPTHLDVPLVQALAVIRNLVPLHQLDMNPSGELVNRVPFFLLLGDRTGLGTVWYPGRCELGIRPVGGYGSRGLHFV
jgi:hypothetical protein